MNFCGSTQILHRKQNNENNIIYPNTFYIGGERMRKIRESAAKEQFLGTIILNNPHITCLNPWCSFRVTCLRRHHGGFHASNEQENLQSCSSCEPFDWTIDQAGGTLFLEPCCTTMNLCHMGSPKNKRNTTGPELSVLLGPSRCVVLGPARVVLGLVGSSAPHLGRSVQPQTGEVHHAAGAVASLGHVVALPISPILRALRPTWIKFRCGVLFIYK